VLAECNTDVNQQVLIQYIGVFSVLPRTFIPFRSPLTWTAHESTHCQTTVIAFSTQSGGRNNTRDGIRSWVLHWTSITAGIRGWIRNPVDNEDRELRKPKSYRARLTNPLFTPDNDRHEHPGNAKDIELWKSEYDRAKLNCLPLTPGIFRDELFEDELVKYKYYK